MAAYFYADNGLLASIQEARNQRAFDVLVNIFEYFDLRTNEGKTVSMACHPC